MIISQVPQETVQEYVLALALGDAAACEGIALQLHDDGYPMDVIVTDLLAMAQEHVGTAWSHGRWSVGSEHRATDISTQVLRRITELIPRSRSPLGRVILVAAEGERHRLGMGLASAVLDYYGWETVILADSRSAEEALYSMDIANAVAVGVSATMTSTVVGGWRTIRSLRGAGARILAGGRQLERDQRGTRLGADATPGDLAGAHMVLQRWAALGPQGPRDDLAAPASAAICDRLIAQLPQRVDAALSRVDTLAPQLLASGQARAIAVDDLQLSLRACLGALLLDDVRMLREHVAWASDVMVGYGSPRAVALLWLQALRDTLPTWAGDVRRIIDPLVPDGFTVMSELHQRRAPALSSRFSPIS